MFPSHLKLNATLSTLDTPEAIGRGAAARPIGVPIYLRPWPAVRGAFKGAGQSLDWIWRMVRRIVQRVAALFGVKVNLPESPPGDTEPAAQLVAEADASGEPAAAQNLADAAAQAASEANAFLDELLTTFPDRDRLKDLAAPAFLADVLRTIGARVESLQQEEALASAAFKSSVDSIAGELGVEPVQVLRGIQADRTSGAFAQLAPLWRDLADKRKQLAAARQGFCTYCIVAMRGPDGVDQPAVDQVARSAMERWADASMRETIEQGVRAPALEYALAKAEDAPAQPSDELEVAAKASLGAAAAESGAAQKAPASFASMMDRLRALGAVEDDGPAGSAKPTH